MCYCPSLPTSALSAVLWVACCSGSVYTLEIGKLYKLGFLFSQRTCCQIFTSTPLCIYENTSEQFEVQTTYTLSHILT